MRPGFPGQRVRRNRHGLFVLGGIASMKRADSENSIRRPADRLAVGGKGKPSSGDEEGRASGCLAGPSSAYAAWPNSLRGGILRASQRRKHLCRDATQ